MPSAVASAKKLGASMFDESDEGTLSLTARIIPSLVIESAYWVAEILLLNASYRRLPITKVSVAATDMSVVLKLSQNHKY